jgi:hypothetical protein
VVSFGAMNIKTICDTVGFVHSFHGFISAVTTFSFGIHGGIAALGNSTVYMEFGDGTGVFNLNGASHTRLCGGPVNNVSCDDGFTIPHTYTCPGNYTYEIVSFCKYSGMYQILDSGTIAVPVCACPRVQMLTNVSNDPVTKQPRCAFSLGATLQAGSCAASYNEFIWNYGDQTADTVYGNTSGTDTIWSPLHTYPKEAAYTTTLTLVVNGKPACTYTGSVNVQANCCLNCPVVNFLTPTTNNNYYFLVAKVSPNVCNVNYDSCVWVFGDGTTEVDPINLTNSLWIYARHAYADQCRINFDPSLTLIGPLISCSYTDPIKVNCCMACPNINIPKPTIDFDTAYFTATVAANSCTNTFTDCTWDFGDGNTETFAINLQQSNVIKVFHVYSRCQQTYTAKVTLNGPAISCSQSTPQSFTMAPLANTFWRGPCTWMVPNNCSSTGVPVANNSTFVINFQGYGSGSNGCAVAGQFSINPLYAYDPVTCKVICTTPTNAGFGAIIVGNTLEFPSYGDFLFPEFTNCAPSQNCPSSPTCPSGLGVPFTGNMYFSGNTLSAPPHSFNCLLGPGAYGGMPTVPTFMIINAAREEHP